MKVLTQNQHFPKWMYRCMESALLDRSDERSAVLYHRTDAPWPVWDRDVVLSTSYAFNSDRTQVELNFHETTSPAKPEVEGVVRMPRLTGSYRLHEYEAGKTRVIYQVDADIGGSIPRWLSTLAARDLPVRTLVGLRERVLGKSS